MFKKLFNFIFPPTHNVVAGTMWVWNESLKNNNKNENLPLSGMDLIYVTSSGSAAYPEIVDYIYACADNIKSKFDIPLPVHGDVQCKERICRYYTQIDKQWAKEKGFIFPNK